MLSVDYNMRNVDICPVLSMICGSDTTIGELVCAVLVRAFRRTDALYAGQQRPSASQHAVDISQHLRHTPYACGVAFLRQHMRTPLTIRRDGFKELLTNVNILRLMNTDAPPLIAWHVWRCLPKSTSASVGTPRTQLYTSGSLPLALDHLGGLHAPCHRAYASACMMPQARHASLIAWWSGPTLMHQSSKQ